MSLKVMTYNTLHCMDWKRGVIDFDAIAEVIRSFDCDVVGLNEIRGLGSDPEYEAQTERLAELAGYPYFYFGKAIDFPERGPYGNAILSKIPFSSVEVIPIPAPALRMYDDYYEDRCIIKAVLENGLTVLVTHFGLNPDEKELAVDAALGAICDRRCVLMGDFNMTPDIDLLAPIFGRMTDTLSAVGKSLLSWPSDEPEMRIDYVFVSSDIAVSDADIPDIVLSDHRPHYAVIELPQ